MGCNGEKSFARGQCLHVGLEQKILSRLADSVHEKWLVVPLFETFDTKKKLRIKTAPQIVGHNQSYCNSFVQYKYIKRRTVKVFCNAPV